MDNEKNQNFERMKTETPTHTPTPVPNHYHTKIPTCVVFSMEGSVIIRVKAFGNRKGSHYYRKEFHLVVCSDTHFNIIFHTCCPEESKTRQLHQFQGMSCFQFFHPDAYTNLFFGIERNGKKYTRSLHNHLIVT